MYEAVIIDSNALQQCLKILNRHTNHVNLYLNKKGLVIMSMNSNQTAFMEINIVMRIVRNTKDYCVGVHVPSLLKITQMIKAEELICLKINENQPEVIGITFIRDKQEYKSFEFKTEELEEECMIPVDICYEHAVVIPLDVLLKI